jgi:hypothetical protein
MALDPRDLAGVVFSNPNAPEQMLMLHCYFDDSGTHGASRLAVWAGVAGASGHFFDLDKRWKTLLAEPLPGKASISKFGLADCRGGHNEFFGYSQGERDRVRHLFRQAIIKSGMHPISFAVDKRAWSSLVTGEMLKSYACGAAGVAFSGCANFALQLASKMPQSRMACVFDRGQRNSETLSLINDAEIRAEQQGVSVTYTFAKVGDVTGLQAADMVATEHYWYGLECLDAPTGQEPIIPVHLKNLVTNVKTRAFMLQRPEILQLRREFRASLKVNG